jgi:phosphate transport system permease protein
VRTASELYPGDTRKVLWRWEPRTGRPYGRAIGEAMAMIMVTGNAVQIPTSPLDPTRTLAGGIAVEINYASGLHQNALFAIGVVLFIVILAINSIAMVFMRRGGRAQDVC